MSIVSCLTGSWTPICQVEVVSIVIEQTKYSTSTYALIRGDLNDHRFNGVPLTKKGTWSNDVVGVEPVTHEGPGFWTLYMDNDRNVRLGPEC